MELKEYIKLLRKNAFLIILFALAGALITLFLSVNFAGGSRFEQLFFLVSKRENLENYYRFEGFYSQEKARNFTDTAVAIISSPDFTSEVVAGSDQVTARKVAPQVIRLSVATASQENARILMSKATSHFNQKIVELTSSDEVKLKPIGELIVPVATRPRGIALVVFGSLIGAVFALVTVGFKTYFKV